MDVHIEESTGDHIFAFWERVMVAVFDGTTSQTAVRRCEELFDKHFQRLRTPMFLLTIVDVPAPLPALEVRMELVASLHRANGKLARSAVVYEGEGFRAASVRAVVAGIAMFSRPTYPHRVFAQVSAAAQFLAGGPDVAPAPQHLVRAVQLVRARQGSPRRLEIWRPERAHPDPALRPWRT